MGRQTDGPRQPRRRPTLPVYEPGQKVHDVNDDRCGLIVDVARQYSHPNADPVHNYLVRWDDGHVEALNERALTPNWGLEIEE
ncbi:MAG: hypothetical protein GTO30_22630 [Acidobacteria bacterium]|nr:hypothetical protein [Acidobacteriota bacterium]NIQ86515.1 hypothetical protein [Acidobacteriota bacterium]